MEIASDFAFWATLLSGGALGVVIGALCMGAHAWDEGFRAGISHSYEFPGKEPFQ